MKNRTVGIGAVAFAASLVMVGSSALAADAPASATAAKLAPAEIVRLVEAAGYTNIHDVEFDDGHWEMEATSPKGSHVDLEVDPATGKVLHEEAD